MTREAKLGASVAGAFLAVVGTWAGIKFNRGEAPPNADANPPAAAAPAENAVAQQNPPSPDSTATTTTPTASTPAPEPAAIVVQQPNPIVTPVDTTTNTTTPVVAAPASTEPPPPSMPEPAATPPPSTPVATPVAVPIVVSPTETPALPVAVPINQENKTEPPPPPPAIVPVSPPASDPPPAPIVEVKKDPEPPPNPIVITKPADPTPPEPIKPSEPTVTVVPAGVGSAASLGAPGSSGAPASGVSAVRPRSEPRVQSYLEEEYRWQPGDGFAAICRKYYFAEKYGQALQEYNRDHPLAGSGMKQNPPTMSPGQAIWIPPVRILERDYANAISDLRPLNDRGGTFVPTAKPTHSPNDTKHFKVRERGETMYEIARRTLGDSGQWFVVHRLNPTLSRDPKLPIPGGTVLQLPLEAKTEPADAP